MTTEEKQLLLKDLSARVPYVTFVYVEWHETEEMEICEGCENDEEEPNIHTLISCNYYGECDLDDNLSKTIYDIKPYLRPMSSMTEEEKKVFDDFCVVDEFAWNGNAEIGYKNQANIMSDGIDWLLKHHFDFRGLINKGLALEAPKNMYKEE